MRIVTKNVIYFETLAAIYIISTSISGVSSHGYMSSPRSLNYRAHVDGLEWGTEAGKPMKENCEHCLNVKDLTGVCGKTGTHNYDDFRDSLGDPMPWFTEAVYMEGQIITVRSELPVHHWGHAELRGCPNGMEPSLECFDQYPLEYIDDVMWGGIIPKHEGYPMYAHFAGSDKIVYDHRFKLPMGLVGQHVLLQWKYITSNSCNPPGYLDYPWPENDIWWSGMYLGNCDPPPYPEDGNRPAGAPEQFWGCAQVTIAPSGPTSSPVPTKAPVPQTPSPTKSPNSIRNPSNQPQQPVVPTPTPPGSQIATTTRYWDCSGGSCGCAYLPSHLGGDHEKPAHCYSNALFAAPEGNSFGAKFYGAAAVSSELGGAEWMGDACGKCWKVTGTSNIPGYLGIETTLVLKGTNYCPTYAQHCELGKAHFDIAAPGFDWAGASLSNSCKEREPDQVGGFESCGTWMINSQNPNQNCNCESFTDPVLRAGCENFRSLYWDNPSVYYEEVSCPDEMTTPCWEENGDSYPEFGEIPDTCMSPTGDMPPVPSPTDSPVNAPTDSPVNAPTDSPVKAPPTVSPVKAPTPSLNCKSSCYRSAKPWTNLCKKEKCNGCPECFPSDAPTQSPVKGKEYCCTWNFHNCGEVPFCNENSTNCQSKCGGSWLKKSAPAMQCIAMYLECTADENACCDDLICSGNGSYKQCVDPTTVTVDPTTVT